MQQFTITLEEQIYDGLLRAVGRENISQFINGLVRSHVVQTDAADLEVGYRAMATDEAYEAEALEWSEALIGDADETARLAAIDTGYGMFKNRGPSVDDFLAERHAESEASARGINFVKTRDRAESDEWTTEGAKITSEENLRAVRNIVERAPIVVEHWFYRGSTSPHRLVLEDFEEFTEYLDNQACAGDLFYVWSYAEVCKNEKAVARGKCPADDGCVPRKGAY